MLTLVTMDTAQQLEVDAPRMTKYINSRDEMIPKMLFEPQRSSHRAGLTRR